MNRLSNPLQTFDAFSVIPTRTALPSLLNDPDWPLAPELAELARQLLKDRAHVGPAKLMAMLAGEVQDYLDYCQFRDREKLRGSVDERHAAWEAACLAEACALIQRQSLREGGYAPPRLFIEPFRVV